MLFFCQEFLPSLSSTFLALPLEHAARQHVHTLKEALHPFSHCLRFQQPRTAHLTLMYWPDVSEHTYREIMKQARTLAQHHAPFSLSITHAETFHRKGKDTVLVLSVSPSDALMRLKSACLWSDERAFHPHITLARIRHPKQFALQREDIMKTLCDVALSVPVDRLRLYAEVDGVKQTPLEDFMFQGSV